PLSFLLFSSFKSPEPGSFQSILVDYAKADRLYLATEDATVSSRDCIKGFNDVVAALLQLRHSAPADSLLSLSSFKLGILHEVNKDYLQATAAYLQALKYATKAEDKFRMQIFAGAGYYNRNNFDSAAYLLLQAASAPDDTGIPDDRIRLYNTLGVLFYDNGNYLQSKNYFTQALRIVEAMVPSDKRIAYSVQLNMATCFYKLG